MDNNVTLYAVRDTSTGRLVLGLTNPSHKFWEKKKMCIKALENYKTEFARWGESMRYKFPHDPKDLKVVKLTLMIEEDV
jgi:hypothetical protein